MNANGTGPEQKYIWICRWEEFQHYPPRRDRGPAWIKDYTAQLDDERYLRLTDRQRALLRDLRDVFATMRGRVSDDVSMLTRRRNSQTRRDDLEALNHAGFIQFVSRATLDGALEKFYASRARPRGREKEEIEKEREASLALPYLDHPPGKAGQADETNDDFGGIA